MSEILEPSGTRNVASAISDVATPLKAKASLLLIARRANDLDGTTTPFRSTDNIFSDQNIVNLGYLIKHHQFSCTNSNRHHSCKSTNNKRRREGWKRLLCLPIVFQASFVPKKWEEDNRLNRFLQNYFAQNSRQQKAPIHTSPLTGEFHILMLFILFLEMV